MPLRQSRGPSGVVLLSASGSLVLRIFGVEVNVQSYEDGAVILSAGQKVCCFEPVKDG